MHNTRTLKAKQLNGIKSAVIIYVYSIGFGKLIGFAAPFKKNSTTVFYLHVTNITVYLKAT